MKNAEKIIERLKKFYNIQSETQLAKRIGVRQSTLSGWKLNDNFDLYRIYDNIKDINLNWLLTGEGNQENTFYSEPPNEYIISENKDLYDRQIIILDKGSMGRGFKSPHSDKIHFF